MVGINKATPESTSGITRSEERIKKTSEWFTPENLVQRVIEEKVPGEYILDPKVTFVDPNCGEGIWLKVIKDKLIEAGFTKEEAQNRIYGIDIMQDNIDYVKKHINSKPNHIICADAYEYSYTFDEVDNPIDPDLFKF